MLPTEYFELDRCTEIIEQYTKTKLDEKRKLDFSINAAGALIAYIADTQKMDLQGILKPTFYQANEFMAIDASSRRNLEITETLRDKAKRGSLLWVLDKTETAMGGRMLRRWLEQPLIDADEICRRLDSVEELKDKLKTKRYTYTRISRILLSSMLGLEENFIRKCLGSELYLKVLAINKEKSALLSEFSKLTDTPIITRKKDADALIGVAKSCFEKDVYANDVYNFITKQKTNEYEMKMV